MKKFNPGLVGLTAKTPDCQSGNGSSILPRAARGWGVNKKISLLILALHRRDGQHYYFYGDRKMKSRIKDLEKKLRAAKALLSHAPDDCTVFADASVCPACSRARKILFGGRMRK